MTQKIPEITLNDGLSVPIIGFGTAALKGNQGVAAMQSAIDNGYRLLDTAYNYENEGALGEAIKRSGIARDELIITSKLPGRYQKAEHVLPTIEESLFRSNLTHFDLYLIHWPNPAQDHYVEAWQALIKAKKKGLIRSIGVCNFLPEHIDRLVQETGVKPSLNQIELHPFFNQEPMRKWHEANQIHTQSWSPLVRVKNILDNETITEIAGNHQKTVAQIILRWHYQLGALIIPRSTSPERQLENKSIFDFTLTDDEMNQINALSRSDGRIRNQDPAVYEEF